MFVKPQRIGLKAGTGFSGETFALKRVLVLSRGSRPLKRALV
jgi:hypothetical protein